MIPIHNKGELCDPDNYRPISILPLLGKSMEKTIKHRLVEFLETNNVLNPCQFGFRESYSTNKAVMQLINEIIKSSENREHTVLTLCDLSKAFDCVSHALLIDKLHQYGIRGIPLHLFASYLQNRMQCVHINNTFSDFLPVRHGVPQGSVLGPVLFILYINDLYNFLKPNKCILFADDTTLLSSHSNMDILNKQVENTTNNVEQWFASHNLKLNASKTQSLTISSNLKNRNGQSVRLLGMDIDDGLTGHSQIIKLCATLSSTIYLFRRLKNICQVPVLRMAYFALFHSHLNYGILLWGNSTHVTKIFILQKKIVRIIANVSPTHSCKNLFIELRIMTLPCLYIYATLLEIHTNQDKYPRNSDIHSHNTRAVNLLRLNKFKNKRSERNSLQLKFYNILPQNVKALSNPKFKNVVRNYLITNSFYTFQEYMDTPPNINIFI